MTAPLCAHDRRELQAFLAHDPVLNAYALGDLDPFFWDRTAWFVSRDGDTLQEVVLLYTGQELPTLLALTNTSAAAMTDLVTRLVPLLPRRFYAHLSPGLEDTLEGPWVIASRTEHVKMGLRDTCAITRHDVEATRRLSDGDLDELLHLYDHAYPGNWFDPRMLATGKYFGIHRGRQLAAVAGVHVYSARTRVAALGNITTHPDHRRRGLAAVATAALCQDLLESVDAIGLNVDASNCAALRLYRGLGFETAAEYREVLFESNCGRDGSTMMSG